MFKKIFISALLFNIFMFQPIYALAEIIEDTTAPKNTKDLVFLKAEYESEVIEDECIKELKNKGYKKEKYQFVLIEDSIVQNDEDLHSLKGLAKYNGAYKLIDEKAQITRIYVSSSELITATTIKEGQTLKFIVTKDVYRDGKIFIKKGTPVNAILELVSKQTYFGDPAEIEVGRLVTNDINGKIINIEGTIRQEGANRAMWVKPLYYAGINVPYFGLLFYSLYFVKGGKAKIKPSKEFEFYYE